MSETRTYQTRITSHVDEPLSCYASLMSQVEHCLFADLAKGKILKPLTLSDSVLRPVNSTQFE